VDEAIAAYRRAVTLKPDFPEAHNNLGIALREKGQLDAATAAYRQALALKPDYSEAHINLGNVLREKGELGEAIVAYRWAIALKSDFPKAHYNLANTLRDIGQMDEAIAAYRQAVTLNPNYAEAHNNLGNTLREKGELDDAITSYRQAIAFAPNYADAHSNLGVALKDQGKLVEAIASYRQAIVLSPSDAVAHYNLAVVLLMQGDFPRGWEEYEWRWKTNDAAFPLRNFAQPEWDGRPLEGRTLLLHAEQGFGDAIQFIRYLPLVATDGGKIILECQPELQRPFRQLAPDVPVLARGQTLPAFDVHCPLLSLPRVFSTDLTNMPRNVPYLHADTAGVAIWREPLSGLGSSIRPAVPALKVGLAWAGRPTHTNDRNRSLMLATLAPLAEIPGVQFYPVQKGEAAAEANTPPAGMELVDVTEQLKDFADTAALMAGLDLVISVDTAVAHLAGALAKPAWTLLPFVPDWRWGLESETTPWYPTMRLFRQPKLGDWDSVIQRVCDELKSLVENRHSNR
jgi:Flp pilus assembly protein TadD